MEQTPKRRSASVLVFLLLTGVAIGMTIGLSLPRRSAVRSLTEALDRLGLNRAGVDFGTLTTTWNLLQERYVERPIDAQQLLRGALDGLVKSLNDPYSFYLSPKESSAFEDEINGKFEGIGMELGLRNNVVVVIAPLPDSPAERSGIRPGDVIVAIDDVMTDGMSLEEAVVKIRGPEGTRVTLTVKRGDSQTKKTIERKRIQIRSVKLDFRDLPDKRIVAIVKISSFTQATKSEFEQAVRSILVRQPAGVILDLRNNPGGYLDAATDVADAFLSDGTIVIEDFGHGKQDLIAAKPGAPLGSFRMAVLINRGSASAAEILAGALQDRLTARTIGERTFGKGSVQEIEELGDGSTVKLTVAHWLTPSGRSIEQKGIEPSIVVESSVDDEQGGDRQLERGLQEVAP